MRMKLIPRWRFVYVRPRPTPDQDDVPIMTSISNVNRKLFRLVTTNPPPVACVDYSKEVNQHLDLVEMNAPLELSDSGSGYEEPLMKRPYNCDLRSDGMRRNLMQRQETCA